MSKIDTTAPKGIEQRVARLLDIEAGAFLRQAYLIALGRGIDRDGEAFYTARLEAGASRSEILKDLANSDEGRAHLARSPKVAAALMQIAGDPVAAVSSVAGLLALEDSEFVETSVRLLLDQGADVETRSMLMTRLRGGTPRFQILGDLAATSGRSAFPDLQGLDEMLKQVRDELYPTARTLEEMFALHDEAFIDCAYKTILRRVPDFKGLTHYVGRLREGYSRSSVVYELSGSSEARSRNVALPGLERLRRVYLIGKAPVVGGFLSWMLRCESDMPRARRRRLMSSLLLRNYALQAQLESANLAASSGMVRPKGLEAAMLLRQEAMIDIQRDSFDREINALRKLVVRMMEQGERAPAVRARHRSPARPAARSQR